MLADLAGWATDDVPRVAVNVSPVQLGAGDLPRLVADELARYGVSPRRLELEVTESALMRHESAGAAVLHELRDLGVTLAIDDFGTGYSSLSRLRDLPVDVLKIDRSFVAALPDRRAERLLQAFVVTAQALEMTTVAEGVETSEQHDAVRRLGCRYGQGWRYAHPMPAADLVTWLRGR